MKTTAPRPAPRPTMKRDGTIDRRTKLPTEELNRRVANLEGFRVPRLDPAHPTLKISTALPTPLVEAIDQRRGDLTRSAYIRRAVEAAIEQELAE